MGDSLPWSKVGHSEGTVTKAAGMLGGTPDSSVRAWTKTALARLNGISAEPPEDSSEVAESLVGLGEMADPISWGGFGERRGDSWRNISSLRFMWQLEPFFLDQLNS